MLHLERASFSGHETFPFRYAWLKKAVDAVSVDPTVFGGYDAMVRFGVGKNMVTSIRHWGLLTGVIEEAPKVANNRGRHLRVSSLGKKLLADDGWDPYLEDPATLWLLHWQIASQPKRATTWYWVFNHFNRTEFERRELVSELLKLADQHKWPRVAQSSVKRDVDCFVRTYAPARRSKRTVLEDTLDCPLVELGLIGPGATSNSYALHRGDHSSLPAEIVVYGLLDFFDRRFGDAKTVSTEELLFAAGAPGRILCLSEDGLMRRLDDISSITKTRLSYDETAGLRQVIIHDRPNSMQILERYYRGRQKAMKRQAS